MTTSNNSNGDGLAGGDGAEMTRSRGEASWLCRSVGERERMLDMDRRLAPVRRMALAVLTVAALSQGHWIGWWTVIPLIAAAAVFAIASRVTERTGRPEYLIFAAWVLSEVIIAATAVIAGPEPFLVSWLAIPVATLGARFSTRGVVTGVAIALGLVAAVVLIEKAGAVADYPPLLISPAALVIAIGILTTALMNSDVEHRGEAVIDPLTGLLNRNALIRRAEEVEQQSAITGEPVAILVADIDRFKRVNDTLGHAMGDAVLKEVTYGIRKQLRAFDLAYRIGGEEFLILVPGSDIERAGELAERMRRNIAAEEFSGVKVTLSFGVSATRRGERFAYQRVFERADAALYEAKRCGRNRVATEREVASDRRDHRPLVRSPA